MILEISTNKHRFDTLISVISLAIGICMCLRLLNLDGTNN